jgi:RNase P subunit RPR2
VLKADPGEYQLLCANCNWIKRYEEEEWVGGREYVRQTVTTRRRLTDEEREARKAAANVKRSGTQRAPTLARDNEIVCSFISGWSKAEIAREHEMTPAAVHAVLKRYGPKCSACGSVRVRNIPVMVDGKLEGEMDDDRHVLMRCKACGHKWPALCPIHDV